MTEFGSIDQPRARTRVFGPSPTMNFPSDEIGWVAPRRDTFSLIQTPVTFLGRQHQKCCQEPRLATMSLDLQLVKGIRATLQTLDWRPWGVTRESPEVGKKLNEDRDEDREQESRDVVWTNLGSSWNSDHSGDRLRGEPRLMGIWLVGKVDDSLKGKLRKKRFGGEDEASVGAC